MDTLHSLLSSVRSPTTDDRPDCMAPRCLFTNFFVTRPRRSANFFPLSDGGKIPERLLAEALAADSAGGPGNCRTCPQEGRHMRSSFQVFIASVLALLVSVSPAIARGGGGGGGG